MQQLKLLVKNRRFSPNYCHL